MQSHDNKTGQAFRAIEPSEARREVLVTRDVLEPHRVLASALQSIRKASAADQIYMEWPNLHKMSIKLVQYLSPIYPGVRGGPLIEDCLKLAVESYQAVERTGGSDADKVGAFVIGLMHWAPAVFDSLLYVQHKDSRWRAWEFFSQPVNDWLAAHASNRVLVVRVEKGAPRPDDCVARVFLCTNIVTPGDFKVTGNILDEVRSCSAVQRFQTTPTFVLPKHCALSRTCPSCGPNSRSEELQVA